MIQTVDVDGFALGQSVLIEIVQLCLAIRQACNTIHRHIVGMLYAPRYRLLAMLYQHIVGILQRLAIVYPLYYLYLILTELTHKLFAQFDARLVHVARKQDGFYALHLKVEILVEHTEVSACTIGYRYHILVTALHQCQRIHHTLGNYQGVGTQSSRNVPGQHLAVGLKLELLVQTLVLAVLNLALLDKLESQKQHFLPLGSLLLTLSCAISHVGIVGRFGRYAARFQIAHDGHRIIAHTDFRRIYLMVIHPFARIQPAPLLTILTACLLQLVVLILSDEYGIARPREAMTEARFEIDTRIATTFMPILMPTHGTAKAHVIAIGAGVFYRLQVNYCPFIVCHCCLVVSSYCFFSCFSCHCALGIHRPSRHDHRVS